MNERTLPHNLDAERSVLGAILLRNDAINAAVEVLQPATTPEAPWRPDYWRDGALAAAGSFALGLLAIGFVELFNRSPPAATTTPVTVVLSPNGPPGWPALAPTGSLTVVGVDASQTDVAAAFEVLRQLVPASVTLNAWF